jgi:hypothetical protein
MTSTLKLDIHVVAQENGVMAPLPQNISIVALTPKAAAFKGNKSKGFMELFKIKVLQCMGERKAHHGHNDRK